MAKGKADAREPSAYEAIGLAAAEGGDVAGTATFLTWVGTQIENVGFFGVQPDLIASRLKHLATDVKKLAEFCDGYARASKAKATKKG